MLARLEEEATQRRIADERARVAAIGESQAAREAATRTWLRPEPRLSDRELDGGPPAGPQTRARNRSRPIPRRGRGQSRPETASRPGAAPHVSDRARTGGACSETTTARRAQTSACSVGRRAFASASRSEVVGGVLLLVATAFAVQALFDTTDGSNAFAEEWSTDVLALVLTAALALAVPRLLLRRERAGGIAGTAIGYLIYRGPRRHAFLR